MENRKIMNLLQELQQLHIPNANVDLGGDFYEAKERLSDEATLVISLITKTYVGLRVDTLNTLNGESYEVPVMEVVFNLDTVRDPYKVVNEFMCAVGKLEDTGVFTGEHTKT